MNGSDLVEEEYADETSAYAAEHGAGAGGGCLGSGGTILSGFAFLLLAAVILAWRCTRASGQR